MLLFGNLFDREDNGASGCPKIIDYLLIKKILVTLNIRRATGALISRHNTRRPSEFHNNRTMLLNYAID